MALDATIAKSNSVGINSWWKLVIATYNPGKSKVIKRAPILMIFNRFAN